MKAAAILTTTQGCSFDHLGSLSRESMLIKSVKVPSDIFTGELLEISKGKNTMKTTESWDRESLLAYFRSNTRGRYALLLKVGCRWFSLGTVKEALSTYVVVDMSATART
jgi:hypothetical protein